MPRKLPATIHLPKKLRIIIPLLLIAVWFVVASIGGPTFGKLSSVSTNDQAAFLPASSQSAKAQDLQAKFQDSGTIPAIIVFESNKEITPQSYEQYAAIAASIAKIESVKSTVIGPIPSEDKKAIQLIVPVEDSEELDTVIENIRTDVAKQTPEGQTAYVTGPAGLAADLTKAFSGIDGILLIAALGTVLVILLIVYRSLLLPILVLLNSVFALCASILLVYWMARWGWITLNGQSQDILSILVIGAATDYSLLLVARYREALGHIESKWESIQNAIKNSVEPIAASAATVILALLCLLLSDLNSNRSLGPIAATGIVFSFLATMSFLPALLTLFGRKSFWPAQPHMQNTVKSPASDKDISPLWRRVGTLVSTRSRIVWTGSLVLLIVGSLGLTQLKANGVSQSDFILGSSQAVDGQKVLAKHFKDSVATPAVIIADQAKSERVIEEISKNPGIKTATIYTGSTVRPETQPAAPPKVVDGKVLINATLTSTQADSAEAEATVVQIREQIRDIDPSATVGGATAVALDTNTTAQQDLRKIVPIVLIVIVLILMILLRSILAPVLLITSVVVSFAAALGVSALVFNHIFNFPGADASVPLFGFIFLIALGIDYNIFLMTRVREEAHKIGTRKGIVRGLGKTGGVITSAGIVLAATFAALGIIPILFLAQIAFIVAFGVLIDAIVVRSLLVPALSYDLGKIIWWPSKLWRDGKE